MALTGTYLISKIKTDFGVTLAPAVERAYATKLQDVINANPTATDAELDTLLVNALLKLSLVKAKLVEAFDENGNGKIDTLAELNTSKLALDGTVDVAQDDVANGGSTATGQTFTLTNGLVTGKGDDLTGTSGNDTFNAETLNVLETGDKVNGSGGTDTLTALVNSAGVTPLLTAVENINVSTVTGAVLNLNQASGYTTLTAQNVEGAAVTFSGINGASTVVGMKSVGAAAPSAANIVTATFTGASLAGTADTVKVELNNVGQASGTAAGTAPDLTIQGAAGATSGAETVTLNVSGTAARVGDLVVVDNAATATTTMTKLEVTGDKNLRIDNAVDFAGAAGNATVDASKFTGALNINVSSADNVTVTGGTGADRFNFGANLTTADKVVGGEGKDTVAATTAVALENAGAVLTGIEVAEVTGQLAAADFDVAKITGSTVNAVSMTGGFANGASISKLTSGAELTVGANSTGNTLTVNVKDATLVANTTDSLTINVGNATTAGVNAGTITATGVENVTVNSTGVAGTAATLGGGAGVNTLNLGASATAVTVTGDVSISLSAANNSITSVDASKSTGAVNTTNVGLSTAGAAVKGSNKADVLAGGAGKDSIEGNAGNDNISGGAGSDSLTGGDGSDTFNLDIAQASTANMDTVNDFTLGNGGDVLNLLNTNVAGSLQMSKYLVNTTTQNVPAAATATVGEAELLILDSTVASLRFANSTELANATFTLTGYAGTPKNVLVAYASADGGDVRLAEVTIAANGDITAATDITTLKGITTAALNTNFDASNIVLNAAAAALPTTWAVTAGVANAPVAGTNVQAGVPITFTGTVATLQTAGTSVTAPAGQANILSVTDAIAAAANTSTLAPAGATNFSTLQFSNNVNSFTVNDARFANVNGGTAADTVAVGAAALAGITALNGGATGGDTINLTGAGVFDYAKFSGFETIANNTAGAILNNVSTPAAAVTVGDAAGNTAMVINAAGATLDLVNVTFQGTGSKTINAANTGTNIIINNGATQLESGSNVGLDVITGGGSLDTLTLRNNANLSATTVTAIETITAAGAVAGVTLTVDAADMAAVTTLTGSSNADTLVLNGTTNLSGAAVTSFETLTLAHGITATLDTISNFTAINGTTNNGGETLALNAATAQSLTGVTLDLNDIDTITANGDLTILGAGGAQDQSGRTITGQATKILTINSGAADFSTGAVTGFAKIVLGTGATNLTLNANDAVATIEGNASNNVIAYSGTIGSGTRTVDLITKNGGGQDTVTVNNAAHGADVKDSYVMVSNFTSGLIGAAGSDRFDADLGAGAVNLVDRAGGTQDGLVDLQPADIQVVTATGTTIGAATKAVIINTAAGTVGGTGLTDTADGGAVELAIKSAFDGQVFTGAGQILAVLYNAAGDAGVYSVAVAAGGAGDLDTTSEFSVELMGVLSGVGVDSLVAYNLV